MHSTLITPDKLADIYNSPSTVVLDCRYSLEDTGLGRRRYLEAHIPGARYARLDEDLSAPVIPGRTGRHPLPAPQKFAATLARWGITTTHQVVAYDDAGGAYAARLWWMLKWLGHNSVAVLDGGWPAWQQAGYSTQTGEESFAPAPEYPAAIQPGLLLSTVDILGQIHNPGLLLIDVRAPERFRGERESIDPVAGHIPGARNLPYSRNLNSDGTFLSKAALRELYLPVLANAESSAVYCGSGVTAAHSILAICHAELGLPHLYAGSWSEWIADPTRPIATSD